MRGDDGEAFEIGEGEGEIAIVVREEDQHAIEIETEHGGRTLSPDEPRASRLVRPKVLARRPCMSKLGRWMRWRAGPHDVLTRARGCGIKEKLLVNNSRAEASDGA